jgi:predicted metal-dependent phosphotriesterase family hydrolase
VVAAQRLRKAGFSEADLDLMFKKNPAKVLGLPPL